MTQRTRYFFVGSALVVVIVLGVGLVARNGGLSFSSSQDDELAYVPADVTAIAYADVRAIMSSEVRQKLREVMPTGEGKDELQRELGLDIERDIDVVVAGFSGDDPSKGGALVLVRGRFNDGLIETTAVQHGARAESYNGKRMLLMGGAHAVAEAEGHTMPAGGHQPAVGFLEPGLLAIGDVESVRQAIDRPGKKTDVTTNAELMKLVNDVRSGANAWAVGRFDAFSKHASLPAEVKSHLPALHHVAVSARVNGGITGTLRADTRDDKAAQDLKAVLSGALAAGRLMAGQDPKANAVLNSLQVGGSDKSVTLSFAVSAEVLDLLSGFASQHRPHSVNPNSSELERRPGR